MNFLKKTALLLIIVYYQSFAFAQSLPMMSDGLYFIKDLFSKDKYIPFLLVENNKLEDPYIWVKNKNLKLLNHNFVTGKLFNEITLEEKKKESNGLKVYYEKNIQLKNEKNYIKLDEKNIYKKLISFPVDDNINKINNPARNEFHCYIKKTNDYGKSNQAGSFCPRSLTLNDLLGLRVNSKHEKPRNYDINLIIKKIEEVYLNTDIAKNHSLDGFSYKDKCKSFLAENSGYKNKPMCNDLILTYYIQPSYAVQVTKNKTLVAGYIHYSKNLKLIENAQSIGRYKISSSKKEAIFQLGFIFDDSEKKIIWIQKTPTIINKVLEKICENGDWRACQRVEPLALWKTIDGKLIMAWQYFVSYGHGYEAGSNEPEIISKNLSQIEMIHEDDGGNFQSVYKTSVFFTNN